MENTKKQLEAKIITLGDSRVGKTSLIVQFIDNKFTANYLSTIGFDLKTKIIKLSNGLDIKLTIHDTAGQERFKSLSTNYIKKANGILLVYDVSEIKSFNNISNWMEEIENEVGNKIPIILVGNKSDLEDKRVVAKEEGQAVAKQYNIKFYETSSKTGDNVEKCIMELTEEIFNKLKDRRNSLNKIKNLDRNKKKNKKKECCS